MTKLYTQSEAYETYNTRLKIYSNGKIELRQYDESIIRLKNGMELKEDLSSNGYSNNKSQSNNENKSDDLKEIRRDSLTRSRNLIIDYACQNEKHWASFITLTFKDKIDDVGVANKFFQNWIRQVKRYCLKSDVDFMYLCVPEFQKSGRVHYHLLTNIKCDSDIIPKRESLSLFNPDSNKTVNLDYYDIKYWSYGYSSAFDIVNSTDSNFNIALYVTKYLYKDIDNRLYGRKKVLCSSNLDKPSIVYLHDSSELYNQALEYINKKYEVISSTRVEPRDNPYSINFNNIIYLLAKQ